MIEGDVDEDARGLFARLARGIEGLDSPELTALSDDDLLDVLRAKEQHIRRLATVDQALVAEIESRGLARERGCSSTASLMTRMLRVSPAEARARVDAARHLAPRRTLSGEPVPAEYPVTAAAQAAGEIAAAHARVITTAIDRLPNRVRDEKFDGLETFLVDQARQFAPDQLAKIARHLADVLDPDGTLRDTAFRYRIRYLDIHQRADGSSNVVGELTARATEALLAALDATAAPEPADDGQPDPRTAGQRRHDGLLDALLLLLRSDRLPTTDGVSTTIVYTLTAEQLAAGEGLARTGHGASVPVESVRHDIADARVFGVRLGSTDPPPAPSGHPLRPIAAYGTTHRIFTESQRLAMIARDHGCSFPGCTVGPMWTQAHHVTDWQLTHRTCVDDGTLLCGYHHREFGRLGWACRMTGGIPHWIPPRWIDPARTPRVNTAHHPELVG